MMFLISLILISFVNGHGRMTSPMTRVGHMNYENDPIGFGGAGTNTGNSQVGWICRHEKNPSVTPTAWTAGSTVTLGFNFGVNHVGFCDGMISYDSDKTREEMRWFKIANFKQCADVKETSATMDLPDWLPSGNAVFRWSWTALHQFPVTEVYSQCSDVVITGTSDAAILNTITKFALINPQLYPRNGNDGIGYADPFNGSEKDRVVGPACALNFQGNQCGETAPGKPGYINVGEGSGSTTSTTTTDGPASTTSTTTAGPASTTSTTTAGPASTTSTTTAGPASTTSTTTAGPASTTSTTTAGPTTTASDLCPSGIFYSSAPHIPNWWCQANCDIAPEWCLSPSVGFCHCQTSTTEGARRKLYSTPDASPCTQHSDCSSDTYCDTFGVCYNLSDCPTFNDAIDGVCPATTTEGIPTTEGPPATTEGTTEGPPATTQGVRRRKA